jgi:TonB family protein
MRIHIEPEETKERLGRPVAVSLSCHAALFVLIAVWTLLQPAPFQFGDPGGTAGSAVSVNVVQGIPITAPTSRPNPVANDVKHEVPAPPEPVKEVEPEPAPEPEAVPIEEPKPKPTPKKEAPKEAAKPAKTEPEKPDNQITSTTGAAASSPLFNQQQAGGAGVGMERGNPFGQGFGWYAEALQRRLSEEWAKTLGQVSGKPANPVTVRFQILRNGRIEDIRVVESSGNRSFDYSAHRAVQFTNPFRALPPGLRRNAIAVEMTFRMNQ